MTPESQPKPKDRVLFVFTDKFMVFWLALAVGGMFAFRYSRTVGILLCAPAVLFFSAVFVMLFIGNRKHKAKGQ